ncbi:N-carbamoylputrescine amidase [Helicobacter heilmannii]|uniref:carbon-nitrogen hydrolase n=1 Tax=Helicobacter heilmannii TaxID=35817 RepID=UPI0006A166CA|nr:carbon-nitrogen hydrolase [Helicobacter heilmannii]CRF48691.1 N-carbamoylputrescine amidase [Helicobacter heilmannii]
MDSVDLHLKTIEVAILQHGYQGSVQTTLEHTAKLLAKARSKHPQLDLVILPELHPYPYFCQHEDPKYFAWAREFMAHSAFLGTLAKTHRVVLVGSLFEERMVGVYHNSAVVFEKDGTLLGVQRKMHIPDDPRFYEKFYFTQGDQYAPIASSVGNLGVLVCWDQWYPEAARLMALQKADILIYPSAIGWFCDEESEDLEEKTLQRQAWIGVQRGHSIANTIPVIASNRVGFEPDPSGQTSGLEFFGSSFIFGAFGKKLAQAGFEEEILHARIDLEQSAKMRQMWPFFRDRRIDTYKPLTRRVVD